MLVLIFIILMTSLLIYVYILKFLFYFTLLLLAPSCPSFSLLPSSVIIIYLLAPEEDNFLTKALVFDPFLVSSHDEYISLDVLFCHRLLCSNVASVCVSLIVTLSQVTALYTSVSLIVTGS